MFYHLLNWKITKCHFFTIIVGFRGFQCCKTLSDKWTVMLFRGVKWFHTLRVFQIRRVLRSYHIRFPKIRKMHFWGTPSYGMVIICFHNPTKSSLAVILRGQPIFYDYRLTRYGFCDFFVLSGQFPGYFWPTNHDTKYAMWFFWLP